MSAKQTKPTEIEQPISDNEELSNDGPTSGAPSLSRSKLNLIKFGEDELLGDMATQAMHLFSNLNFPNLKNEIPGLILKASILSCQINYTWCTLF